LPWDFFRKWQSAIGIVFPVQKESIWRGMSLEITGGSWQILLQRVVVRCSVLQCVPIGMLSRMSHDMVSVTDLSCFLFWVPNTQLKHWTKWMVSTQSIA